MGSVQEARRVLPNLEDEGRSDSIRSLLLSVVYYLSTVVSFCHGEFKIRNNEFLQPRKE